MDQTRRQTLIERYKQGYDMVAEVVGSLGDADLDAHPEGGGWSPREIVHHLADSELMGAVRLRRLLTEDHPPIQGYDQEELSHKLQYDRPIASSLAVFRATRVANAELLERMSDDAWAREGIHSERGRYTVDDWLEIYSGHLFTHVEQIRSVVSAAVHAE